MIAFDTNHLLRHILQDDPKQCRRVTELLERQNAAGLQVLVLDLVVMEACWLLTKVYGFDGGEWDHVLEAVLNDGAFAFEDASRLRATVKLHQSGRADFNDYLILLKARSQQATLETFDKKLKSSV